MRLLDESHLFRFVYDWPLLPALELDRTECRIAELLAVRQTTELAVRINRVA